MARMRSPNYPAIGLADALQAVQAIWDKEKRTSVGIDVAAKAMGYKSVSGPVRTKIAALRKYGLVDQEGSGMRVSDLAMRILHGSDSADRLDAIREAALNPELFRELYETHGQASDDALRSHLVIKKQFSESGAKALIKGFRETFSLAKLPDTDYNLRHKRDFGEDGMQTATEENRLASNTQKTRVFSWPLSKTVSAEVRLFGDDIEPSHLELLSKYIELTKLALKNEQG